MTQKKLSAVVYCVLLVICFFALGYLAGMNHPTSEVQVTVTKTIETPQEQALENDAAETSGNTAAGVIDLNTADQLLLQTLPGIGPELSARIVAYREEIGGFVSIEQIKDVRGIGDKRYEELKQFITVGGTS